LVENLDHSAESDALVAALEKKDSLEIAKQENSRKRVADGKAPAALVIPNGYGEDLRAGTKPALKLFRDPSQTIEQQIIPGSVFAALGESGGRELARATLRRRLEKLGVPSMYAPQALEFFDRSWDEMHGSSAAKSDSKEGPTTASTRTTDSAGIGQGMADLFG